MKKAQLRKAFKKAFTLIEVLIVVAIIGIIIGIAVPALNSAREDALNTKADAISAQVATAKARYFLDNHEANEQVAPTGAQLAPYLLVNGATVTDANDLLPANWTLSIGNMDQNVSVTRP